VRYIIGLGNSAMADDGVGLRIVEHCARSGLERGFEAVAIADEGTRLLSYLTRDTEKIVLVDAVDMGLEPGEYRLFRPDEVESRKRPKRGLTSHEGDILKVLQLAASLGYPVPRITILGIQPENVGPGLELSEALGRRFETYLRAALEEIARDS